MKRTEAAEQPLPLGSNPVLLELARRWLERALRKRTTARRARRARRAR